MAEAPELREFKRPLFAPPGGEWFASMGADGPHFSSKQSMDDVVHQVTLHLIKNGKDVPDNLKEILVDAMCAHMPPGVCSGNDGRPQYEVVPSFFQVVKAMEDQFRGKPLVTCTLQEAEERMRTCLSCERHSMRLCTTCDGLRSTARQFVGGRKTKFDGAAGVCMVYQLPLSALVHIAAPEPRTGTSEKCWVTHGQ
jgi:hypothetical protein